MSSQEMNNNVALNQAHPQQSVLSIRKFFTHGGSMQRLLIALLFSLVFLGVAQESKAQFVVHVSGYLTPSQTRTFYSRTPGNTQTDTIYVISGNYSISGKLLIQEGAEVQFLPGGRIVDSVGGKIIANGFTGLRRRIQFRGVNINSNSYEWGHILVLPGADSVFFANCRFAYFRKKESIDNQLYFGAVNIAGDPKLTNSLAIIRAANGTGGVMTTFSAKTYLYDVIADSCQAIYRGGAFAFLQAPSDSYFPSDDGRLALVNRRVRKLLIRDTRVFNETTTPNSHPNWADTGAYGGAIYMGSRLGATSSDFRSCFLGYSDSTGLNFPGNLDKTLDTMHFERCTVNNPNPSVGTLAQQAYGGAIYVGDYTGLTTNLIGCHTDSAIAASGDVNMRGGAIYVSKLSADPTWLPPPSVNSRRPGLAIFHRARFLGNVAGMGGAIFMDYQFNGSIVTNGPALNIDGDNIIQNFPSVKRDSGFIDFASNTAYREGGAIYQNWFTFITGYLAPQTHVFPRWDSVELRVRFVNNAAGLAGGAIYLNPNANPDIQSRRVKHLANFVNPADPRINRPSYINNVKGGGAEFIGTRDSAFAVEYSRNYVIGGNGGAVYMNMGQSGPGVFAYNRFLVEDKFVATTPTLSPLPFDPRELTRFCENYVNVGVDSLALFNRTGRGGALYVDINNTPNPVGVGDTLVSSRVRFEKNQAFSGSAIHSNNYRLQIVANQTLVANNFATSRHSYTVDLEKPNMNNPGDPNAGATIWADFEGPAPQHETNSRGNAIYDNVARYIIRLPDGPHGYGGVDTVRGNFWGEMGPSVITQLPTLPIGTIQSTFFIDFFDSCVSNVYEPNRFPPSAYTYVPIGRIPDTLLFEGRIYDIYDRGLDIKTLDYNNRRLAITEGFSLGLPTDIGLASNGRKGIHRWTRDIFQKDPVYLNKIIRYQSQFSGPHPIGYPLFLTADVDTNDFNRDKCARNYTTVFVFNETTQEYIRVNLKEEFSDRVDSVTIPYRGRIDFVPDSTIASRHPVERAKLFWSPTLIRPSNSTYLEIARAAKLEDSAALDGRAYFLDRTQLQNVVGPDTICTMGINANQTFWYAGERYGTLPVRPGDNIVVFSRTQLWKYGYAGAKIRGITFPIGDVIAPFFAGDVPKLQSDTINPNRLFVREDNQYKKYTSTQTPADILFRIGGYDVNNFYDPRWLFDPYYTMLDFSVTFAGMDSNNYRLPWWISRDTVRNVNPNGGSNGYIQLYGTPHNPDVVPGGEPVHVVMTNWPPNRESEHLLLDKFPHAPGVLGHDSLKLSMWIYPRYMNCPEGFLSDTICVRRTSRIYDFRIFVQDSLPVFLTNAAVGCNGTANLTDSLRYDYDVQTDDELEDSTVFAYTDSIRHIPGTSVTGPWDFRYGRTSYSDVVAPLWLKSALTKPEFLTKGKIHVAIDSLTAYGMITPTPQVNGELLLDTIAAIQADDGHTGKRTQQWHATINVEPKIVTTSLQNAKEDFDYSTYVKDTTVINRILINDPNFADTHTFHLVYKGQTEDVYRDGRYKTGKATLVGATPNWLKINPVSGVLSGVPGINDAPRLPGLCGGPEKVTVVVQDQCGLTAWKTFNLNVDSTQHQPSFLRGPRTICVRNKTHFCDTINVHDRDLLRLCAGDTLLFTVLLPDSTWTVTPSSIGAPRNDTAQIAICGQFNEDDRYFGQNPPPAKFISVAVTDQHGNYDTITYRVYIGDAPTFECAVTVSNKATATHPNSDIQRLCFGAGRFASDSLDIRYCEFEVPAAPPSQVFDGRWELPVGGSLKGSYIDIRKDTNQYTDVAWQIRFSPGADNGAYYYPIRICWKPSCFDKTDPFTGNFYLVNPFDPNEFSINMKSGLGPINHSSYTLVRVNPDSLCLEINNVALTNARIVFVPPKSDVATTTTAKYSLQPNHPNPMSSSTTFGFTVAERSNVKIELYDVKGTLIRTLVNESVDAGGYPVVWDGTDVAGNGVANGSYICKMTAGGFSTTMKITLNK